jgi:hypothetical protein
MLKLRAILWTCVDNLNYYLNLVVLPDRHATAIVLLSELFWQGWTHDLPSNMARGVEVPFSVLPSVWGDSLVELHLALRIESNTFSW